MSVSYNECSELHWPEYLFSFLVNTNKVQLKYYQNFFSEYSFSCLTKQRIHELGMATSTRLTGYSLEHPIIEYQNRYSVTRKTFFYENNDKIFRTINN